MWSEGGIGHWSLGIGYWLLVIGYWWGSRGWGGVFDGGVW